MDDRSGPLPRQGRSALQFGHSVAAVDDGLRRGDRGCRGTELQFGHSVAAVDDDADQVSEHCGHFMLQFGHSVAAVDDPAARKQAGAAAVSFNSATASPPWMTDVASCRDGTGGMASIRPQLAAVDDIAVSAAVLSGWLQFGHSVAAVDDIDACGKPSPQ